MPHVHSRATFFHALALVAGFSLVFTLLGASVGLLGGYALYDILPAVVRVGGILLVIFALRVAHLHLSLAGWLAVALLLGGVTYLLNRFPFDPSFRYINAGIIALTILSGARWDRLPLAIFALLIGLLSWITSDSLLPAVRIVETLLIIAVIFFGNRTDLFDRELRLDMGGRFGGKASYWRSGLVGVIFAAGWTPCVGPILSGILLLASQTQTVGQGALLLAAYSAGLGIPFLIAGALFSRLAVHLPRFYRHLPTISLISGLLLLLIGLLIFTDSLAQLAQLGFLFNLEEGLVPESISQITLLLAFLAGGISFLSPCVLPLVPAYLGYLSGAALGSGRGQPSGQAAIA